MECIIPNTSVKNFIKAVTCLTKIGESINFEISPSRFILRTLGQGESSYFQLTFSTNPGLFFEKYDCYHHIESDNNSNNDNQSISTSQSETNRTIKARIKSKIFLSVFRLTDSVQNIGLKFITDSNKLEITSTFPYNIQRKYTIRFEDIPTILQAEFDYTQQSLQQICCVSNTFRRILTNFANSLAEITLILSEQGLAIKSFIDTTELNNDSIQTECHLKRNQNFTKFNINLPSQVKQIILTVVQKEFKAFLTACQLLDEEIQMYLTVGGAPLLLTNDENSSKGISMKLIMATISDDNQEINSHSQPNQTSQSASEYNNSNNSNNNSNNNNMSPRSNRSHGTLLAQQQQTPITHHSSVHSNNNNNTQNSQNSSPHLDDDDVIVGIPTHGNFMDENNDFFQPQTINTTQKITINTMIENENEKSQQENDMNINNKNKNRYKTLLQPHPDSLTNINNNNNNRQNRNKEILPESSQSGMQTPTQPSNNINSLETQHTLSSGNKSNNNNNNNYNYISSFLDDDNMTQTQRVGDGQIQQRFEREKKRRLEYVNDNDGNNNRPSKRQKYNNNNNNNNDNGYVSTTSTLRKKPKSKWQDSPF